MIRASHCRLTTCQSCPGKVPSPSTTPTAGGTWLTSLPMQKTEASESFRSSTHQVANPTHQVNERKRFPARCMQGESCRFRQVCLKHPRPPVVAACLTATQHTVIESDCLGQMLPDADQSLLSLDAIHACLYSPSRHLCGAKHRQVEDKPEPFLNTCCITAC